MIMFVVDKETEKSTAEGARCLHIGKHKFLLQTLQANLCVSYPYPHIPGFPGVLDFLEFFNLFSRPANSLNLAVFVIISLHPLEIMRSIGRSSKLLSYIIYISPNFFH